jgi:hypothetical protein
MLHRGAIRGEREPGSTEKSGFSRTFEKALFRTRTGDPLLTMEVLCQLS